jgi:hypothetical protein
MGTQTKISREQWKRKIFFSFRGNEKESENKYTKSAEFPPNCAKKGKNFTSEHEISHIDGDRSVQELGNQETRPEITPH